MYQKCADALKNNQDVIYDATNITPKVRQRLFDEVVAIASGKMVKSEKAGFHDMAIFKQGVTL